MSNISKAVTQWANKNIADIKGEWGKSTIEGNGEINFKITKDSPNEVSGEFTASGQTMWMTDYGTGSTLDRSNPLLSR